MTTLLDRFRGLFPGRARVRQPSPGYRPCVEGLEQRALLATATLFQQTALVSDQPGRAPITDPQLTNAWGIAVGSPRGDFWIADNGSSVSTLYNGAVTSTSSGTTSTSPLQKDTLTVTIPGGNPTGTVFNSTSDFNLPGISPAAKAIFLFATEKGQISGWNPNVPPSTSTPPTPSTMAQTVVNMPDAVFKGLAIGSANGQNFLYATDFKNGVVRVFDANFQQTSVPGGFIDKKIPKGFAPFNVQNLNGQLYVTYAKREKGKSDEQHKKGLGFVDVFDTSGNLVRRLASRHNLNAPWGVAIAPSTFGKFAGDVLVGNFGDGKVNVFNPNGGKPLGQLQRAKGKPLVIDGLWALTVGNGTTAGDANTIFFTAGPKHETHGLFGTITMK
jgi:uncharacterized protein (TIGR03118 family)